MGVSLECRELVVQELLVRVPLFTCLFAYVEADACTCLVVHILNIYIYTYV